MDSLSRNMAFYPPSPPTYTIAAHGDGAREAYILPAQQPGLRKVSRAEVVELPVGVGRARHTIVATFVPAPRGRDAVRPVILHCHGNAVDLGNMMPMYDLLAKVLHVNVMAFDYSGYGQSGGQTGVSACLQDISAVYGCLLHRYGRRPEEIVLYGQSVGSGPASWLAARTPGLGGILLHSPFLSGMRVLNPSLKAWPSWADIFPNIKHLPKVASRTLIIHVS
jgi:pimeloyl-ACP methyl ester carboxylesterase